MMKKILTICLFSIAASSVAQTVNERLADVEIKQLGKLSFDEKGHSQFTPWTSTDLRGKKWVVQHIAPRASVGTVNMHLSDALFELDAPNKCRTVSIVNLDEALWGTKNIAKSKLNGGLKRNLHCIIVADDQSTALNAWGLPQKGNATYVIDEAGMILFFHQGELSDEQVEEVIRLSAP